MPANQAPINVGVGDNQLLVSIVLPAAGASSPTGIIDLGTSAPNSNAWRMGRFQIILPAVVGNTAGAGITVTMQCAGPSLTAGSIAPAAIVPGAFVTPPTSQITTIPAVAVAGSGANTAYQVASFDSTGSTYQFYQWVVTVPAQCTSAGEVVQIVWIKDSQ